MKRLNFNYNENKSYRNFFYIYNPNQSSINNFLLFEVVKIKNSYTINFVQQIN